MNTLQITIIILGALFAICGIVFFAVGKGIAGENTIKLLGFEFKLTGSALVIFVLGCVLIIVALRIDEGDTKREGQSTSSLTTIVSNGGNNSGDSTPVKTISEQINEASELLSNRGDTQSHINGILALEKLYKQSGDEHWRIVELLVSFIRNNAKWQGAESRPANEMPDDVNMALRVLATRTRAWGNGETKKIELNGLDLRGANLRFDGQVGANFKGFRLIGAHLEYAKLQYADLEEAILMDAVLDGANLFGANLHDADLKGISINGADLQQARGGCRDIVLKYTTNLDARTKLSPCKE